jgi:hypothetical protein
VTAEKDRTASVEWCRELSVSRDIGVVHSAALKEPRRCGTHESIDSIAVSPNCRNANAKHDADALSQQSAVAEEHGGLQ